MVASPLKPILAVVKTGRFNPLHCGAVVASNVKPRDTIWSAIVSIPFIAGQWSLPQGRVLCNDVPEGFNPLHCGAVVASPLKPILAVVKTGRFNPLHCGAVVASGGLRRRAAGGADRFNPLHCGAVVASF